MHSRKGLDVLLYVIKEIPEFVLTPGGKCCQGSDGYGM